MCARYGIPRGAVVLLLAAVADSAEEVSQRPARRHSPCSTAEEPPRTVILSIFNDVIGPVMRGPSSPQCVAALLAAMLQTARAQYPEWQHSGSLYILTTPEGANLPPAAAEEDFPFLVRLNHANFDFSQARANGEDIRISADGKPLAYQVEEWDAAKGIASIWVRIPVIRGNTRQEIKLHWAKLMLPANPLGFGV